MVCSFFLNSSGAVISCFPRLIHSTQVDKRMSITAPRRARIMDTRSGKRPLCHHPSSLRRNLGESGSTPLPNHPQLRRIRPLEALQQQERCTGSEKLRIGDKQSAGVAFGLQVRNKGRHPSCAGSGQLGGRQVTSAHVEYVGRIKWLLRD